jgi:hypothetical protein
MEKIPRRKKMEKAIQEPIRALFTASKRVHKQSSTGRRTRPREKRGRSKWPA